MKNNNNDALGDYTTKGYYYKMMRALFLFLICLALCLRFSSETFAISELSLLSSLSSSSEESAAAAESNNHFKSNNYNETDYHNEKAAALDLQQMASRISNTNGVVMIQFLTAGYLAMTKSWICNIRKFPRVLQQSLIVATDQEAYDTLMQFRKQNDDVLGDKLNIIFLPYEMETELRFGILPYYKYMLFRTENIVALVQSNVTIMVVESDSLWTQDPTEIILSTAGDIVTSNDDVIGKKRQSAGFQLIRPTEKSKEYFSTLLEKKKLLFERCSNMTIVERDTSCGSEQDIIRDVISQIEGLDISFLPDEQFPSGLFYHDPKMYLVDKAKVPIVIQNNYIVGNQNKIDRAKEWGHWYLSDDEFSCIEPTWSHP